jgi:FkbM family methyltransferase
MSALKERLARRWPRATAAYHAWREPLIDAGVPAERIPEGFVFSGPERMKGGSFEPAETAVLQYLLRDAPVFIDVGANVGYFVCLARQTGCHVVAVEPSADNLRLLYANLVANGWDDVEVFPLGVGSASGIVTLYGGGTAASLLTRWAGTSPVVRQTIAMSTLDTVVGDRFGSQALVIKVDVEGSECAVLEGAMRLVERSPRPAWVVEVCLTENFASGVNPRFAKTFDLFASAGYEARAVDALDRVVHREDVARWVSTGRRDFGYVSYFFADPSVSAAVAEEVASV